MRTLKQIPEGMRSLKDLSTKELERLDPDSVEVVMLEITRPVLARFGPEDSTVMMLHWDAETDDGEPVGRRFFPIVGGELGALQYLAFDCEGWKISYIGPIADQEAEEAVAPCCSNPVRRRIPTFVVLQKGRHLRRCELRGVSEVGIGQLRPAAFGELAPRCTFLSPLEPLITEQRGECLLECAGYYQESGHQDWLRMPIRTKVKSPELSKMLARFRVTYVGPASHWPTRFDRAHICDEHGSSQWVVRVSWPGQKIEAALRLEPNEGTTPLMYFKLPRAR